MRKIVAVHHPHLDTKLLDQVLLKFYWLREQSELRKKPSTVRAGRLDQRSPACGPEARELEAHIPFVGALLKKEQDVDALSPPRDPRRALSEELGRPGPRYNQ
jgi:hypothetical protein